MFRYGDIPFPKGLARGVIKQRELSRLGTDLDDPVAGSKTVVRDKVDSYHYDYHCHFPSLVDELKDEK